MTTEASPPPVRRFVQDKLPWVIAGGALVVYLLTLNSWLTVNSLSISARVAGWDWNPVVQPALFIITLPFRWLSPTWVPLALNASTALCAALVFGLLARSVSILPHDRFAEQERLANNPQSLLLIRASWIPPLLAAILCGLQLTFWENAVSASGQMLDLLLFAYVIRCLLEYRLQKRQTWVDRAALVCGVAMANDWAMLCFFPLLVVAGLVKLFQTIAPRPHETSDVVRAVPMRMIIRMGCFGLAGVSLGLLLPLVQGLSPDSPLSFWQALRAQAAFYWHGIEFVYVQFFKYHRDSALLLSLVSLFPVLLLSIRWRSFSISDRTDFGLGALVLLIAHAGFLIVCFWVAFDPFFGPRQIAHTLGFTLPFLTFYYLAALSVGYYSGFFLLLFSRRPPTRDSAPTGRAPTGLVAAGLAQRHHSDLQWIVPKVIYLLTGVAAAGLLGKNLPVIRATNRPYLEQYGRLLERSLPREGAIVFSGDPLPLLVLQATVAGEGRPDRFVPVAAQSLPSPSYQRYLHRRFPQRWPDLQMDSTLEASNTNALDNIVRQVLWMSRLAQSNRLFCFQPSWGKLLELFYLDPQGLAYELKPYPTNSLNPPPLTAAALAENEALWSSAVKADLDPFETTIKSFEEPRPGLRRQLMDRAHLESPVPLQLEVLARTYAVALDSWGVTLQRNGRAREATSYFERAQKLNPRNLAAAVNLQCNTNLLANQKVVMAQSPGFEEQASRFQNPGKILLDNGPVDEPVFCFQLGLLFTRNRLFRQSSQQFERVRALASGETGGNPPRAEEPRSKTLALLAEIRAHPNLQLLARAAKNELDYLQSESWFNDLTAIHQRLRENPDDVAALINEGFIFIQLGAFSNAIPPLTRALELTNSPVALLNRAVASVCLSNLDVAQADYMKLRQAWPNDRRVDFGMGEIAYKRGDTNAAIAHYKSFLASVEATSEEARYVNSRLNTLKGAQ
jgi:tetratricopeptide (TPR) repeat protein